MHELTNLLVLATEGVEGIPADHIAAKLAVPVAILLFCGSVFLLLWSNYGAKKGALIYATAFFGFCFMLGVFWWFGAPGTPVATGVQNFPGQPADQYNAHWFAIEPGSQAAEMLPATNNLGDFSTIEEFAGASEGPRYNSLNGDLSQAGDLMTNLAIHRQDDQVLLGGQARSEYLETAQQALADEVGADAAGNYSRAAEAYTAEAGDLLLTRSNGTLMAGTEVTVFVNYVNDDDAADTVEVPVDTKTMFAFKQESILWFPSMVWTLVSLLLFVLSLLGLDRIEMRERRREEELDEPESLAVPIRQ